MKSSILIKNGRVIDPTTHLDAPWDVLIEKGRIARLEPNIIPKEGVEVIDAKGRVVAPGLIDCHVHLREPGEEHKEDIRSGTRAAAKGGFTTVICEPNTKPPIDSAERVEELRQKVEINALVRVYTKASMTLGMEGKKPSNVKELSGHFLVKALSEDGNPVVEEGLMRKVCRQAALYKLPLSCHCEDSPLSIRKSSKLGFKPTEPFRNEPNFVSRDIRLAEETGANIHISHVSMEESLKIIRQAKARSHTKITCEVTPHHLFLEEGYLSPQGPVIVNPPLRPKGDRESLIEALWEGIIDIIASDHAPHKEEDKKAGAPGVIGLETTLGLVLSRLVRPGIISLMDAIKTLSTRPAETFGIEGGTLSVGTPADITIIDLEKEWVVYPEHFESLSTNCPFENWRLKGQAVLTMVGGKVVMQEGKVIS
ncbi:MAG: dihydroorotase [Candidatus Brocadiales bacterium]|nr:dihydroorotase [Candidatus Brocadiales bacterium]